METSNTRKTNKNKNIKHKNQTTLLTNITQKHQNCRKKQFFIDWKQNKKQDKNKNTEQKQKIPKTKPTWKQKGWNIHHENKNKNNRRKK